jgi:hypothetical protein
LVTGSAGLDWQLVEELVGFAAGETDTFGEVGPGLDFVELRTIDGEDQRDGAVFFIPCAAAGAGVVGQDPFVIADLNVVISQWTFAAVVGNFCHGHQQRQALVEFVAVAQLIELVERYAGVMVHKFEGSGV